MGANNHPTVSVVDDGDESESDAKQVALVSDPVEEYSDGVLRRRFANKYSEVNVMARGGANNHLILAHLLEEIRARDLDPQRALDLHDVPNFVCPECDVVGLHSGRTDATKHCDACGHRGTASEFEP